MILGETKMNPKKLIPVQTPMIEVEPGLYAKVEACQMTGSVKDRFVFAAVKKAVDEGTINGDSVLVEATSGNTGISLSAAGAILGLHVVIVMPSNMSEERKDMMKRFGAEIIEVGPSDFQGAIKKRNSMVSSDVKYWSPMQFENVYNIHVHRDHTAPEIHVDMKEISPAQWDFVSGAGTGGTLMGVYQWTLDNLEVDCRVIQVAPMEDSKSHGIQGINDGADFLLDRNQIKNQILVSTEDAISEAQKFSRKHGILVGISSGANLVAARKYMKHNPARSVVTLLCDRGERYFSIL